MIDFNQLLISTGGYLGSSIVGVLAIILYNIWKTKTDGQFSERSETRNDFEVIKDALFEKQEKDAGQIQELKTELGSLQRRLSSLEARSIHRPFPEWGLGFDGRYTWCNAAMAMTILGGKPSEWIIGKKHSDIWDKEVVELLEKLDQKVRVSAQHYAVATKIRIPNIETEFSVLVKWGLPDPMTGAITNYYGMLIPME